MTKHNAAYVPRAVIEVTSNEREVLQFGLDEMAVGHSVTHVNSQLMKNLEGVAHAFENCASLEFVNLSITESQVEALETATMWASSHTIHKYGPTDGAEITARLLAKLAIAIADINAQR